MKLFLTSAGIAPEIRDEFLKFLEKDPQDCRLIFVPTAEDPNEDKRFIEADEINLRKLGFEITEVDLKNETENSLEDKFADADVVYVEGGNTFYLLDWARKSGFDNALKKFLERGGIYVGVSAGSMIAGINIESANWEPPDDNNIVALNDLSAMNLVDFVITPHYCGEIAAAISEAAAKTDYAVVALTDKQAILIAGGKTEIIGPGKKTIFNSKSLGVKTNFSGERA